MKIRSLRAVPFRAPHRGALASALGVQRSSEYGLIRLVGEDGTEGIGEISLIWHGDGAGLCDLVNRVVAPAVVGVEVFEYSRVVRAVHAELQFGWHSLTAVAGIEMALLDLQGKLLDRPVVDLLGGRLRDKVRLSMSLSIGSPEAVVQQAAGYLAEGFTAVKVKADADTGGALASVRALRSELGENVDIRVDFNMAISTAKEALIAARAMAELNVLSIEQPLAPDDLAGMAFLTEHAPVPIMADESVWSMADAKRVIDARAADLINVYVAEAGGIRAAKFIADLAELNHVGIAIGSMPETGTGTAAAAHLAFSVPVLEHPSDVAGLRYHADDVVEHNLKYVQGHVLCPTGPGLGIVVNEEKLSELAIRS